MPPNANPDNANNVWNVNSDGNVNNNNAANGGAVFLASTSIYS